VPDVRGKFGDIAEVATLAGRPGLCRLVEGEGERLVVGEEREAAALHHEPEVADPGDAGEKLPVEGGIARLRRRQLLREETEGLPARLG